MINGMRDQGLSDPEFGIYEHFFRIGFRNRESDLRPIRKGGDLNKKQLKALEFLKKHKSIKTNAYMKLNNTSFGTARRDINELVNFKYLKSEIVKG